MMDLRSHLDKIAGPASAPSAEQLEADLGRGHRALRRRRVMQTAAGSAFAIVAGVTAVSVAGSGGAVGTGPVAAGTSTSTTMARVRMVAYTGVQPKGFTIDKVPDGWFVQARNNYQLVIAPDRAKHAGPTATATPGDYDPLGDPDSFVGKIGVMLESKDQHGPPRKGKAVKVGGQDATLLKSEPGMTPDGPDPVGPDGDTGWEIWIKRPSGVYVIVQFWEGLGFSQDEMVDLSAGVHVHPDAERARG